MTVLGGELAERRPKYMVTIGQFAAYAGVTIKAVRHYHRRGLLEEPPRDASGHRRYSAQHAVALVKIKTLAEAGVPLARIKELLAADPDRFAAAIADIDRNLRARAEELLRTREPVARLRAGDRLFASCDYHLMSTLKHWAGRRHGHKSPRWVFHKYWRRSATGRLEFSTPAGLRLVHHADTPI